MYVESTESNENYPFLLVNVRNSIVNFVNFLTYKQEKSTCLCIVHFNKNMFRAFCSPTVYHFRTSHPQVCY